MPRTGSGSDIGNKGASHNGPEGSLHVDTSAGQTTNGHTAADSTHLSPGMRMIRSRTSSDSKITAMSTPEKSVAALVVPSKISKRESLKVQKRNYRSQKKQAARELLSTLKDPSVIVLADWLKVRGTLKSWTKLWCVLKPGLLILYKSEKQKSNTWVGTVLLNTCRVIERPSKKDGFCFKIFHPLDQSFWATKGPKGETIGAIVQPLPYSYLIFRAPSESAGKCWMDALELSLRCTNLLMRSMTKDTITSTTDTTNSSESMIDTSQAEQDETMNDSDCERHFAEHGLDEDCKTDREETKTDTETDMSDEEDDHVFEESPKPGETPYLENKVEELGQQGDVSQTETVDDDNKSIIWALVKQVRPGMDLSKVVLPSFILEPRSFLDKLTDYYYHCDLLSEAVLQEDAYTRMKSVVRWYLSGFYKKPKGLKKPYNPIIGETFRCYWHHPKTNSRTFYIAEQLSHHPPVSAFHITNRHDGFNISGSILAKSKFYGNSLSAILDGRAKLTFLKRGEDYYMTMPYAHCKGILIGTLTMEMGGKVHIECPKTGYRCDLEFKLKPFLGIGEASNKIVGKIKMGSDTLSSLEGYWDQEIYMKDKATGESNSFWQPNAEVKAQRLKRFTVPIELQEEMESERLWKGVSNALASNDQHAATHEKHILEERQRNEAKERKAKLQEWIPKWFERDRITAEWVYKCVDMRPWDNSNDLLQFERDFNIQTWTRHKTPVVRTCSIASLEQLPSDSQVIGPPSRQLSRTISRPGGGQLSSVGEESGSSTAEHDTKHDSDSSEPGLRKRERAQRQTSGTKVRFSEDAFTRALEPVIESQTEMNRHLRILHQQIISLQERQDNVSRGFLLNNRDWILLALVLALQVVLQWIFR